MFNKLLVTVLIKQVVRYVICNIKLNNIFEAQYRNRVTSIEGLRFSLVSLCLKISI